MDLDRWQRIMAEATWKDEQSFVRPVVDAEIDPNSDITASRLLYCSMNLVVHAAAVQGKVGEHVVGKDPIDHEQIRRSLAHLLQHLVAMTDTLDIPLVDLCDVAERQACGLLPYVDPGRTQGDVLGVDTGFRVKEGEIFVVYDVRVPDRPWVLHVRQQDGSYLVALADDGEVCRYAKRQTAVDVAERMQAESEGRNEIEDGVEDTIDDPGSPLFVCVVCQRRFVDAASGFDTCAVCTGDSDAS